MQMGKYEDESIPEAVGRESDGMEHEGVTVIVVYVVVDVTRVVIGTTIG